MLLPRISRLPVYAALTFSLGFGLVACGAPPTPPRVVTSVTVAGAPASITVGGTAQLSATVVGSGGPAQTVTWKSSDTSVATVNNTGLVTAVGAGTATITATSTANTTKSAIVTVTVTAAGGGGGGGGAQPLDVMINFTRAGGGSVAATTAAGYLQDTGAGYDATRMYGWVTGPTAVGGTPIPVDVSGDARDRTGTAEAGTAAQNVGFVIMQCPTAGSANACVPPSGSTLVPGPLTWEYKVPNGAYTVSVGVGDPQLNNLDSRTASIRAEGGTANSVQIIDRYLAKDSHTLNFMDTKTVTVTDGYLTIDPANATGSYDNGNAKIDWITIKTATP